MRDRHAPDRDSGFSLPELLVVVGIIALLAAVIAPAIGQYFRNYRIREAQGQIAASIQRARGQAISKNVNFGVSFVIESPTRYWVHIEDDLSAAHTRDQQLLDVGAADPAQSTAEELPRGIRFAAGPTECPDYTTSGVGGADFAANSGWFRFNRLGGWRGNVTPPDRPTTADPADALMNDNNGSLVCVFQEATGLSRALVVSPGGRVRTTR